MSLQVNGAIEASSMRWLAPWSGVWSAELDIPGEILPSSGPAAIASTEGIALVGTVDELRSGSFGQKRRLRVIGGGAGWGKPVQAQHYHSDVGVQLFEVASTTAVEAGEAVTVLTPKVVGIDFTRQAAPHTAGEIFVDAGVDWWVGLDGITRVGTRLPVIAPTSLEILDVNLGEGTASFTAAVLVEPGTVVIDDRLGTPRIVREVDATVSGGAVTGTLWLVETAPQSGFVNELVSHLGALANAATRAAFGRFYEYRVIAMSGDRVELQAVEAKSDGVPDILPTSVWSGSSGYRATLRPASRVLVGFKSGDRKQPFVAFYEPPEGDGWRPVELELDAVAKLAIGAQAVAVVLGAQTGALPIARAPAVIAFAQAVGAALTAAGGTATAGGITPITSAALGGVLTGLGSAIKAAADTMSTACPSAKVVAS